MNDLLHSLVSQRTTIVKQEAAALGFDYCGIAEANFLTEEANQ